MSKPAIARLRERRARKHAIMQSAPLSRSDRKSATSHDSTDLTKCEDVLSLAANDVEHGGLVAENRNVKLVYLTMASALTEKPVSLVIKGDSGSGKSAIVDAVRALFPEDAYLEVTVMSKRWLNYARDLAHRTLIIKEAPAVSGELQDLQTRELLSSGCLINRTVRGGKEVVEKTEGPTGMITTTTATRLHEEIETRVLSLKILNIPERTKRILIKQAERRRPVEVDYTGWHQLYVWLKAHMRPVHVPFGHQLAKLVRPDRTRVHRDFEHVQTLVETHALLHQLNRKSDRSGTIIAEIRDYEMVYKLVHRLISENAESDVRADIRQTVQAVTKLVAKGRPVSTTDVAAELQMPLSTASRRLTRAAKAGFVRKHNNGRGPADWRLANPLPGVTEVLPAPDRVAAAYAKRRRCRRTKS